MSAELTVAVIVLGLNGVAFLVGCAILLRINLVHEVRAHCIKEDYEIYHKLPRYDSMMWQLHKWSYKQFTKGLK